MSHAPLSSPTEEARPPEPPPPLGGWPRFYTLIAVYHIVVVALLWLLTHVFQIRMQAS